MPAALAALAGEPPLVALTLAALVLARSVPTVVTVRHYLRAAKSEVSASAAPVLLSSVAAVVLLALGFAGAVPHAAAVFGLIFFLRAFWLAGPWHPTWPARRVGQAEAVLGLLYVVLLALTWPAS